MRKDIATARTNLLVCGLGLIWCLGLAIMEWNRPPRWVNVIFIICIFVQTFFVVGNATYLIQNRKRP